MLSVGPETFVEPSSSFHDVLSFNAGLNKYLADFKKGSAAEMNLKDFLPLVHLIDRGRSLFYLGILFTVR